MSHCSAFTPKTPAAANLPPRPQSTRGTGLTGQARQPGPSAAVGHGAGFRATALRNLPRRLAPDRLRFTPPGPRTSCHLYLEPLASKHAAIEPVIFFWTLPNLVRYV